jgi:hypothetical protein
MPDQAVPPFFSRLWLAFVCLFRVVFDPAFAAAVAALRAPRKPVQAPSKERPTLPATPHAITVAQLSRTEQALNLLSMFQREGRLIDFCEEELSTFSDAQIGAAARTVHEGCRKVIRQAFTLDPIRRESEGSAVSIPGGFNPGAIRLTGNIIGNPPFKGVLRHHGWKVTQIKMSSTSGDATILAPAEVELP